MECFPKATLSVLTDMEILTLCLLYMIYCKECYLSWHLALIEYIGFVLYFDLLLSWEEWWYIWLTQIQNPNTKIVLKPKSISKIDFFFFIFLISKVKEWQYLLYQRRAVDRNQESRKQFYFIILKVRKFTEIPSVVLMHPILLGYYAKLSMNWIPLACRHAVPLLTNATVSHFITSWLIPV